MTRKQTKKKKFGKLFFRINEPKLIRKIINERKTSEDG